MRSLVCVIALLTSTVAAAKAANPVAIDQKEDIRVLGKLNVNCATREQLLTVPGLDRTMVDALIQLRQKGPISDLSSIQLQLPADALEHLKTDGDSDYRRIRRLPLQVVDNVRTARR
jgi:DNA uptake protein ComE-like DNA-binding protein